jgi:hypothetical protein
MPSSFQLAVETRQAKPDKLLNQVKLTASSIQRLCNCMKIITVKLLGLVT